MSEATTTTEQACPPRAQALTVRINMTSDWAVGSGAGRPGDVDRLIRRDSDGFPFVPGKQLTGLWRDACETVADGLDEKNDNRVWHQWVDYLFGDQPALEKGPVPAKPRPAAVSIRAARLPEALRDALKNRPELQEALTFVKPGVKIARRTGRALAKHLRFVEHARQGVTLEGTACLDFEDTKDAPPEAALAMLEAGAKMLTRLGGKRRRGAGRCQVTLEGGKSDWLEWIAEHENPAEPPPLNDKNADDMTQVARPTERTWKQFPLTLTARTPLVISSRTVGNVNESLDYIPGTYLLPLVTRALTDIPGVGAAIACGDILVTHATPEVAEQPGRPVPTALFYEKMGGGLKKGRGVYNRLKEKAGDKQLKGHRAGYIGPTATLPAQELPAYKTTPQSVETHNTVEDDVQRPTEAVGGVFSYQSIAAGTTLRAEVRVHTSVSLLPNWSKELNRVYRLGAAKKDDYGEVQVNALPEAAPPTPAAATDGPLTVWLLSDLLLRDDHLRPTASVTEFAKALGKELGVTLKEQPASADLLSTLARRHRTDSWHTGWTLPRPSLVGLAAGSCFVFNVTGILAAAKLADLAASGLGERRAEGYGQMCFNDPLLTTSAQGKTRPEDKKDVDKTLGPILPASIDKDTINYAQQIQRAAWRQVIQRQAVGKADGKTCLGVSDGKPTQAQLGSLRNVIAGLHSVSNIADVEKWVKSTFDKRKDKWPDELIALKKLINDKDTVWNHLGLNDDDLRAITITSDDMNSLKKDFWAEAVRTLVDACIRETTRRREQNAQGKGDTQNGS